MEPLLNFIRDYGLPGFLVIVILLLIQEPERATKLQALLIKPFFRAFRWGSRQYIAAEVGHTSTEYLRRHITALVPAISPPKIKIRWVTSPSDPLLHTDGTLIIRLQESDDQTRNILSATRVALPLVVCPTLRTNLEEYAQSAIDLTILKNLSEHLGKHARPVFQRYFLTPEISEDTRAADLFTQLVRLDDSGIFVSILLEELTLFGDYLYSQGDTADHTDDILPFVQYLVNFASRVVGEHIELEFLSGYFRIAIVLLALSWKAETLGLPPYIRRMDKNIRLGSDSIYIAAYPQARPFLRRLVSALDSDARISLAKRVAIPRPLPLTEGQPGVSEIALYRRNTVFEDATFAEKVEAIPLHEGDRIEGQVTDVSQGNALVDIGGLFAVVSLDEADWPSQSDCRQLFQEGTTYQFLVRSIDYRRDTIHLTRRFPESDPWLRRPIPSIGDVVEAKATLHRVNSCLYRTADGFEVIVPVSEAQWGIPLAIEQSMPLGSTTKLLVTSVDLDSRIIGGSIRRLSPDPWMAIHQQLPAGSIAEGIVIAVHPALILVQLPNGLAGYLPRQYVEDSGRDYADFTSRMKPGGRIDVLISNVFTKKQKIRLSLPPLEPGDPTPA